MTFRLGQSQTEPCVVITLEMTVAGTPTSAMYFGE
jgi:hypothetical protein